MRRMNNKGVSLAEIMVVVAIMAVLISVGITSVNAMNGRPAQQCAQKIVYSLEKFRTTAMSRVDASYTLSVDPSTKEIVCTEWTSNGSTDSTVSNVIGRSKLIVNYQTDAGSTYNLESRSLTLQFDRSSGAFRALTNGEKCTRITVTAGGRSFSVALVPVTGKVYID